MPLRKVQPSAKMEQPVLRRRRSGLAPCPFKTTMPGLLCREQTAYGRHAGRSQLVFTGSKAEPVAMSHADDVREHCRAHYLEPARARGESTVSIRAGDVHSALGYKNRLPLVC